MNISIETATKIAEAWKDANNIREAMKMAGLKTKDKRAMFLYRRQAEEMLGIELPSLGNTTHTEIKCPSTLDLKDAKDHDTFVITSHTNNSPIVENFLKSLENFCSAKDAQLLVVPVRYRNANAMVDVDDYLWDKRIYPYVLLNDLEFGNDLIISSHRLNATTIHPLQGKQALNGDRSVIYGHPQLSLEMVGTPNDEIPKAMMTTGSINDPQYTSSDTGGKAAFHHSLSAVVVKYDKEEGVFHYTQLSWDGSAFQFFDEVWDEQGVEKSYANIVHGDSHVYYEIPEVTQAKTRLNDRVKALKQFFHDLHDHHIGSHHATLRERIEQSLKGEVFVEEEVKLSVDYIERLGSNTENYIIGSNHHDHLDKWLDKFNPNKDPSNAKFAAWLGSIVYGTDKNCLEACFDEWGCSAHYEFVDRRKRYDEFGIDLSQHGDKGTNGARGSIAGFAKTMAKTVIGHSHTPGIKHGCYQVGCSTDRMTYSDSYSTWLLTDCLIYPNGKRALVNYIKNKSIFDYM